jgi:hypothetical protein
VVLFVVDSEAKRLAVESSLNERTLLLLSGEIGLSGSNAQTSILVIEPGQSPYDLLGADIDPTVQIMDLTETARGIAR